MNKFVCACLYTVCNGSLCFLQIMFCVKVALRQYFLLGEDRKLSRQNLHDAFLITPNQLTSTTIRMPFDCGRALNILVYCFGWILKIERFMPSFIRYIIRKVDTCVLLQSLHSPISLPTFNRCSQPKNLHGNYSCGSCAIGGYTSAH